MKKQIRTALGILAMAALFFTGCPDPNPGETGRITGKVVYENADNSSGIVITLDRTDGLRAVTVEDSTPSRAIAGTAFTSKDGSFSFSGLEEGVYTVYASSETSTEKLAAVAQNVKVRAGTTVTLDELKLTATGSISGKITVDNLATGNEGFMVFVAGTSYIAVTDTNGDYEISNVPAGKSYQIIMMKGGLTFTLNEEVKVDAGKDSKISPRNFTTEEIKTGVAGEKGDKGDTGATGPQGEKGETGSAGISIKWLGYFASEDEIESPEELDAFYNTTDGCSYIYNGTEWEFLAKAGAAGEQGGTSLNFLTVDLLYNQYGPNYQNLISFLDGETQLKAGDTVKLKYKYATDKKTTIDMYFVDVSDGGWTYLTSDEQRELNIKTAKSGKIISGTLEKVIEEVIPSLDPKSMVLCLNTQSELPGEVKVTFTEFSIYINDEEYDANINIINEKNQNATNNITAYATDRGIEFRGRIPVYTYVDYTDANGYNREGMAKGKYSISVREANSGIEMFREWVQTADNYDEWRMTYPLVEPGKTYTFNVSVSNTGYTFYSEAKTVTATAGLGEFVIINQDDYTLELTDDRVLRRTATPEFTDNPKVQLENTGVHYILYRNNGNEGSVWNGDWLYEALIYSSLDKNTLPLKELQYYAGWRSYEDLNKFLSGKRYGFGARTYLQISGYSDNGAITFRMPDLKEIFGDWGGEVTKAAILYGVELDYGNNSAKTDSLENYINSGINDQGDAYETKFINIPGELKEINGKKYYVQFGDYLDVVDEPVGLPEIKMLLNGEDIYKKYYGQNLFRFKGWTTNFPLKLEGSETVKIDGEQYYVRYNYAKFAEEFEYTINYKLSENTDDIFYSQNISMYSNVSGYNWGGFQNVYLPEAPEKTGYKFVGWYYYSNAATSEGTRTKTYVSQGDRIPPATENATQINSTLYAEYERIYSVTIKDGDTTLSTQELVEGELPSNIVKEGYVLKGYYSDKELTLSVTGITGDMTLYTKWEEFNGLIVENSRHGGYYTYTAPSNGKYSVYVEDMRNSTGSDDSYFYIYINGARQSELDDGSRTFEYLLSAGDVITVKHCKYSNRNESLSENLPNASLNLSGKIKIYKGVVVLDPATYTGNVGEVVDVAGEKYLKVTVDGYNTMITFDEVDLSGCTEFSATAYAEEANANFNLTLRLADSAYADISSIPFYQVNAAASTEKAGKAEKQSWNSVSETMKCTMVRPMVQDSSDSYAAQSGVVVYIGKIIAE